MPLLSDGYASSRDGCLSKLILFGEASLRGALGEFLKHCHDERNHQDQANLLLFPAPAPPPSRLTLPLRATNDWVVCSSFTNRPHEMFDLTGSKRKSLAEPMAPRLPINAVKEAFNIQIYDPVVAPATFSSRSNRLNRGWSPPISIGVRMAQRLQDWLQ